MSNCEAALGFERRRDIAIGRRLAGRGPTHPANAGFGDRRGTRHFLSRWKRAFVRAGRSPLPYQPYMAPRPQANPPQPGPEPRLPFLDDQKPTTPGNSGDGQSRTDGQGGTGQQANPPSNANDNSANANNNNANNTTTPTSNLNPGDASGSLASASGAAAATAPVAPGLLGDSISPFYTYVSGSALSSVSIPLLNTANRFKISSNQSPLPTDRVFFNYQFFNDVAQVTKSPGFLLPANAFPTTRHKYDFNQYTIGGEKTWNCKTRSIQIQVPIITTLGATIPGFISTPASGLPGGNDAQLGNISLIYKRLLYRDQRKAFSWGLAMQLPTANNVAIDRWVPSGANPFGGDSFSLNNDAVILSPYLGFMLTCKPRLFVQGFVQWSLPLNDNHYNFASVDHFSAFGAPPTVVESSGDLKAQSMLYADASVGYWVYRNDCCSAKIKGIAPMVEMHYTTTLQNPDSVAFTDPTFGPVFGSTLGGVSNPAGRQDFMNITAGVNVSLYKSTLRIAYVRPVRSGFDWPFDFEVFAQINRFF